MKRLSPEVKGVGFILRLTPAQEADVIVKILTATGEKITAFAKAGLKSRKRFGGALQPLLHIEYRAIKKQNQEIFYLEETVLKHDFQNLRKSIEALTAASYAAELIEHSAHEGLENIEIYNLFGATLRALDGGLNPEGVLRQFEVKLLSLMGWLPEMFVCSECGNSTGDLTLNPYQGVVTCSDCGHYAISLPYEVQDLLQRLLGTSVLKNVLSDDEAQKIERITSALLTSHWGEQKLKSKQFLGSLRRFQK